MSMSPGSKVILLSPLGGELLADLAELGLDDRRGSFSSAEDRLELGDRLAQLRHLLFELGAAEAGEPAELHVEDVLGLHLGELERRRHERLAGGRLVGRRADRGDDLVDHVEGLEQALDDVGPVAGPSSGGTRTGG